MSGDGGHPNGPDTHLLVSLHQLLQTGERADAPLWHVRELQLCLPRLAALDCALLLTGLGGRLAEGKRKTVTIAQPSGGEDGRGRGEAVRVGLLRMGGRATAAGLCRDLFEGAAGQ